MEILKLWHDSDKPGKKALQQILRHEKDDATNGLLYKAHIQITDPSVKLFNAVKNRVKLYQFDDEIKSIPS